MLACRIAARDHQNAARTFFTGVLVLLLRAINSFFMVLDRLFIPGLRKKKPAAPIVISGSPRTGTTFVQRFLEDQGIGCGTPLVQLAAPSLVIQRLIRPFLSRIERRSPVRFYEQDIHETGLTRSEADDLSLVFRYLDGVFYFSYFLTFSTEDLSEQMEVHQQQKAGRDLRWLSQVWRRRMQQCKSGRNLAKLFSLPLFVPVFQKMFPAARIIYLVRDPLEYIPSAISLMRGVLGNSIDFSRKTENEISHWVDNLYRSFLKIQQVFWKDWTEGNIDREKVFILRYPRLLDDFENLMNEIWQFLGNRPEAETIAGIRRQALAQKSFIPEKPELPAGSGLSAERIKNDFAFYYSTFLS